MKRSIRLGSIATAVVGAVVALAWLVKDRLTGPAPSPVGAEDAPRVRIAPPPPPAPVPPPKAAPKAAAKPKPAPAAPADDLSEISGIGPVYKARLASAGITTFAALAKADAIETAERIEVPVSRVQAWVDAARRRA